MKLAKALEILDAYPILLKTASDHDFFEAFKLGIQALIRERNNRINPGAYAGILLPGETAPDEVD